MPPARVSDARVVSEERERETKDETQNALFLLEKREKYYQKNRVVRTQKAPKKSNSVGRREKKSNQLNSN